MVVKLSVNTLSFSKGSARDKGLDLMAMVELAYSLRLDGISLDARDFTSTEPEYLQASGGVKVILTSSFYFISDSPSKIYRAA